MDQTILRRLVVEGQAPESVLLPTPAPFYSNPDRKDGHYASYPIGGPGWEHDTVLATTVVELERARGAMATGLGIPSSVPVADHICTDRDPLCTFPQRWMASATQSDPLGCGMHACRPQDPWCQNDHRGPCPRKSDRVRQVPVIPYLYFGAKEDSFAGV